MSSRFDDNKPEHNITEKQCQEMIDSAIDKAIDKHNKNATIISMCIGLTLMFFYADGLLRVVDYW